jgi:hypothetical protein
MAMTGLCALLDAVEDETKRWKRIEEMTRRMTPVTHLGPNRSILDDLVC